jgi:hypothetical protein
MSNKVSTPVEGHLNRRTWLIAALITATAGISVALINHWYSAPAPQASAAKAFRITGRVVNARDHKPVSGAKVSIELAGVAPVLRYSDGEGVFDFTIPGDTASGRITVDAASFKFYDRLINVSQASGIEEIRLESAGREPKHSSFDGVREPVHLPTNAGGGPTRQVASMIDSTLRPVSGNDGPWSVVIFGGRQDRRSEVQSWVRSALAGSGHDTVSLFRKVSDEQRVAPELYRASSETFATLQAGRYVSKLLVANLTVADRGATQGLYVAEAKLSVHLLSPAGEMLKDFELSEKGGGLDADTAQRNAIDELKDVIQRQLPSSI